MRAARLAFVVSLCCPVLVAAQVTSSSRVIEFRFTPTARAQIAIWIEKPDGTFLKTIGLTQAVAVHGIGNRPGATQMNSGFHWPYGRREGVLSIWAHRRAAAPGAAQFKRVIFQDRASEGDASRTSEDSSPESYFCLSFTPSTTRQDALDAVSCASAFNSDKGRFLDGADVTAGYAEPTEIAGQGMMRPLDMVSLYPPRRDLTPCASSACAIDTPDTATYADHVRQVMPDIDTVTMATPPGGDVEQSMLFTVPDDWADGDYVAWAEVNTEGDYNATFNAQTNPTPTLPNGAWDTYAENWGYAYQGQPSVVFSVPFSLGFQSSFSAAEPVGYGDDDGFGGNGGVLHPMDGLITDDSTDAANQGSGADRFRLIAANGYRFKIDVRGGSATGTGGQGGGAGGAGGSAGGSGGADPCQATMAPSVPTDVSAAPVDDPKHSHQWGDLHFVVPASAQALHGYEVKWNTSPITVDDPTTFDQALPAMAASLETQALVVPATAPAGTSVDVDFGGMNPLTQYWVGIRAVNICNVPGPYAVAMLTTTRINFTKLSGCFIATAAYGSALEPEVQALRTMRDVLRPRSGVFAAATDLYYRSGPAAAAVIARSDVTRAVLRTLLAPVVQIAQAALPMTGAAPPPTAQEPR